MSYQWVSNEGKVLGRFSHSQHTTYDDKLGNSGIKRKKAEGRRQKGKRTGGSIQVTAMACLIFLWGKDDPLGRLSPPFALDPEPVIGIGITGIPEMRCIYQDFLYRF